MRRIGRLARGPGLIVVVSDFREGSGGDAERSRDTAGGATRPGAPAPGRASRPLHTAGMPGVPRSAAVAPEWARALGGLAGTHDVLAVEVVDPREGAAARRRPSRARRPRDRAQRVEADSSSAELRRRFAAAELARRDELKSHLRRARARHVEVATDADWLRALGRSLR